jgi:hypothetical protein
VIAEDPLFRERLEERLQPLDFSKKVQGFREIVRVVSERYRLDCSRLLGQLDEVTKIAADRNDIVHGWIKWDSKTQRPVFRNKRKPPRGATAADTVRLCKRLERWFGGMADAYEDFLSQFQMALTSA